jgi:hypothetical protein
MKQTQEPQTDTREPGASDEPMAAMDEPGATPPRASRRLPAAAFWLTGILVLVIAGVAAAPFWGPAIVSVLPWGGHRQPGQDRELTARVERLEGLSARVQKLEGAASRPDKTADVAARLDRLENTGKDDQRQAASASAEVQKLDQRLAALEAKPATAPAELGDLRQQIEKLAGAANALSGRLDAIEKTVRAQASADATDTGLLLVLLQMRDAVAAGRPFTAEYDAFAALSHERNDIAAAAAPLAGVAAQGVAGREVLRERLDALAGDITSAKPAPATADWPGQAWARLRSLVTIRRVGGAGQSTAEAAVGAAQRALAQGDIAIAIAKLESLTGAPADAAKPWLQMAHARLTVELALRRTEQLLTARLAAQRKSGQP